MADEHSGQTPAIGGGLLVFFVFVAGILFGGNAPISSLRPDSASVDWEYSDKTKVPARLWQDPFTVVRRYLTKEQETHEIRVSLDEKDGKMVANILPVSQTGKDNAKITLPSNAGDSIQTLAVMMPGGSYGAQVEWRLRMRYAVLTALAVENYAPEDAEHLRYLRLNSPDLPDVIPYEWHVDEAGGRAVLVLWLDQSAFGQRPLQRLNCVAHYIKKMIHKDPKWSVLGPSDSTTLLTMIREIGEETNDPEFLKGLHIYSPFATVSEAQLEARWKKTANGQTWPDYQEGMHQMGITLVRTIADDGRMARMLVDELRMRGIEPACNESSAVECAQHIVLLSEFDTHYGRALPEAFIKAVGPSGHGHIHVFHYLRGVDGRLPGEEPGETGDKASSLSVELPSGRGQSDYLRRLAIRLQHLDRQIRNQHPVSFRSGVRAIGVLGSDVYDKLMVMQALRPFFPDVVFFTTDLDAAWLHPGQWKWARNLVIASAYDLRPQNMRQSGVPPFRSMYQTAAFLSTHLALEGGDSVSLLPDPGNGMIFEVGRGRAVPLLHRPGEANTPDGIAMSVGRMVLVALIALGVVLFVVVWCSIYKVRLWSWSVGFVAGVCLAAFLAALLPLADTEEPFSWTLGISIWPTEYIRIFILIFIVYSLLRIRALLERSDTWVGRMLDATTFSMRDLWQDHLASIQCYRKRILWPLLLYLAAGGLLQFLSGIPQIPYRGAWAQGVDAVLFGAVVLAYALLAARVLDATWMCRLLLRDIGDRLESMMRPGKEELRMTFLLVAGRTETIGNMIHYPMIGILMMTAACSRFFDNWFFPVGLIALVTGTFLFIAGCFVVLRYTARTLRHQALDILRETRQDTDEGDKRALEEEISSLQRGAFRSLTREPWLHAMALFLGGGGSMIYMQLIALLD